MLRNALNGDGHYLALGAIIRDEAPHLEEWLAFHEIVGVEHFYLLDNGSSDGSLEILADRPNVTVVDFPGFRRQLPAYGWLIDNTADRTFWLAVIDADEFLLPECYESVPSILRDFEGHNALGVNWAMFGTSAVSDRNAYDLILDTFHGRAQQDYGPNHHIKSIVQPRAVDKHLIFNPHYFGVETVDTNHRPLTGPISQECCWDRLRLNHYTSRSIAEAQEKAQSPRADTGQLRGHDLLDPELNQVDDFSAYPYGALVRARIQSTNQRRDSLTT